MDRKRILVIAVSLAVSLLATFLITRDANLRYATASRTVTAYEAGTFLPLRSVLTESDVKAVKVPASLAPGLATGVTGKTLLTTVMAGDLIYANELSADAPLPRGMVSVSVAVNQSSADEVTAGDTVDVWGVNNSGQGSLVAAGAKVLAAYDSDGNPVSPGVPSSGLVAGLKPGGHVAAVVELMVSSGAVQGIVRNSKDIYLVRVR